jgi:hypothetical protein
MLVGMEAVVIYESEFGATRAVAEAIVRGLESAGDVTLADSRDAATGADLIGNADLVVVGAPTHARMMPSPRSRQEAITWPSRPGSTLTLQPRADAPGVREWLHGGILVGERQDFLVRGDGGLVDGELDRARDWTRSLAGSVPASAPGASL